jgi:hypothetical protein
MVGEERTTSRSRNLQKRIMKALSRSFEASTPHQNATMKDYVLH